MRRSARLRLARRLCAPFVSWCASRTVFGPGWLVLPCLRAQVRLQRRGLAPRPAATRFVDSSERRAARSPDGLDPLALDANPE